MGSRRPTKPILTQGLQALSLTNPWIWLPVHGAACQVPFNRRTRPIGWLVLHAWRKRANRSPVLREILANRGNLPTPRLRGFPSGFGGLDGAGSSGCVLSGRIDPTKTVLAGTIAKAVARCLHRAIQRLFSGPSRSMAGLARLFLSVERFEWRGGEAIPAVEWLEPNGLAARQSPTAWPNRGQPCLPHG